METLLHHVCTLNGEAHHNNVNLRRNGRAEGGGTRRRFSECPRPEKNWSGGYCLLLRVVQSDIHIEMAMEWMDANSSSVDWGGKEGHGGGKDKERAKREWKWARKGLEDGIL